MPEIIVSDVAFLCTESRMLTLRLWSNSKESIVWNGTASDIPQEYASVVVQSFDPPDGEGMLTLNIE